MSSKTSARWIASLCAAALSVTVMLGGAASAAPNPDRPKLFTPKISASLKAKIQKAQGLRRFQAPSIVDSAFFSLEVAPELTGAVPVAAGMHRLWDMKVAWTDVNPAPGVFDWSVLDARVAQAEASGASPLLVLGLTPQWAAADPNAGDPRWGIGTASPPSNIDSWRSYVQAVVDRYGSRIGGYEVWNEANLQTFWTGTPQQMAELTAVAYEVIEARNPNAVVLTASTTTRLRKPMERFFRPYLTELKNRNYPFDAFAIHTYPAGNAGPNERYADVEFWQGLVVDIVGPTSPVLNRDIFDTEVNYGLAGPGAIPGTDYDDRQGAELLARTFVDSARLGIDATFWYMYTAAPFDLLGVQFTSGTPQIANAWNVARSQMLDTSFGACTVGNKPNNGTVRCTYYTGQATNYVVFNTGQGAAAIAPIEYAAIQTPFDAAPSPCTEKRCTLGAAAPYPTWLDRNFAAAN